MLRQQVRRLAADHPDVPRVDLPARDHGADRRGRDHQDRDALDHADHRARLAARDAFAR